MIKKGIIFITIAYIIGLALGFQLDPSFQRLSAFGLYSLFFFMIGAGSYFLSFKYNKILMFTALGLAAVYFGLYQYTQAMDTSSPEHIVHSLDKTGFGETTIRGVVTEDPDIRPTYINLIVQPYEVQADPPFGKFKKVKKGKVIIRLTSSLKQYYQFDYADKIEVRGNFEPNAEDNNPGIFDQQSFYIHQNIWGRMAVKDDRNITLIGKQYPNKIIEWSYLIKDKMLLTIKKTMRFPESAFLGGVTLGLRSGLSYETQEEFRRTGIAHVLAVSGLHVGFIYILLWSLFGLFKIPKKISAVPIMFLLLLFVFITGARPATVRAAMMVSILIVFTSFLKGKLQNDLLVSLAITALIYLVFINPLMLVEASFVMSFTAILSIALFAGPISHLLTRYVKGYTFLAFITTAVLLTTILMTPYLAHLLFSNTFFLILFILIIFGLFKISLKLNQKNPHFNIGIAKMGPFIIGFMGVQFGITLGNVFPISGIYFQRFAISGLYANWIAIPLIGVIVQLGMIAGILGFLFTPLALVINAANFIFAKFFLGMAHFFAVYFPYPVVPKPTALQILLYYTVICILIWYPRIKTMIKDAYYRVILLWEKHELRKDMIILFASLGCIVIIGSSYIFQNLLPSNRFKMTFIDTKALGRFGDGNAFLLECPGNKNILINAGPGYFNFNNFVLGVSVGETVIRPMLSSKRITTLEGVILQNLDPACIGGVPDVLENFNVKQLYSYYSLDKIAKQVEENLKWWTIVNENDFNRYTGELTKGQRVNLTSAEKVEIKNLIRSSENSSSEKTEMINALFKKDIPEETSSRILQTLNSIRTKRREKEEPYLNAIAIILGEPDLKEKKDTLRIIGKIAQLLKAKKIGFTRIKKGSEIDLGRKVKIKVLYPSDTVPAGDSSDKNLILMAMAEDKKILIAGNATPFAVNYVMQDYGKSLKCDILGVPNYGASGSNPYSFIKLTSPSIAVCHYYYTKGRYFESDVYLNYHCRGSRFYKTDDNGAIVLTIRKNRIGSEKWIKNEILRYQTRKKRAPHKEIKNKKKIFTFSSIDTGAGNAYLIRTPDNKNYLFNGGRYGDEENISDAGKGIIVPFLKKRKIRSLDGVFLINTVKENIGGLYSVLGSISAGRIYKSPYTSSSFEMSKVNEIASINNIPVRILKDNESISLGRDVKCRVLNPSESGSDEKDSSLVLKITYKDFSLLITGDIQGRDFADEKVPSIRTSEYTLLKNHKDELNSLIMTVPDSGYKNSSTFPFLEAVDPQYAILNIRKFDRYNPSDDVLSRYQMIDSRVWRSDYDGNIDVYSDGHAVQIETEE